MRSSASATLLRPGETCWRIARATRAGFLVDADAYFRAVRQAFLGARRTVFVIGWDVDSRVPIGDGDADWPTPLGPLLSSLVDARPDLHVYVLGWDYSPVYMFEREPFQRIVFGVRTPPRVHFALDDSHPPGGSHHQKIVVVDDGIAFCGGLDLCDVRWDTPEHRADDPRRLDLRGRIYRPHHDVQMVVDGEAAAALGEVARERWFVATAESPAPIVPTRVDWPAELPIDVRDVDVAITRTMPMWGAHAVDVREVERLWLDSIAMAQRRIYIENPYFTSSSVADVLAARLREPDGPEVLLVIPQESSGWLEDVTMGVLRDRVLCGIYDADVHGRLRIVSPYVPGPGAPVSLNLHSKVCIVDDAFVRIGSSNLTNRSMGLDTECDLAFVGDAPASAQAIVALRDRLLGEHLDVAPDEVNAEIEAGGSLFAAVDRLAHGDRTLLPYRPCTSTFADTMLPEGTIVDPDEPLTMEKIAKWLFSREPSDAAEPMVATGLRKRAG